MTRRNLLRLVVFSAGIYYVLEFFLPPKIFFWRNPLSDYLAPVGDFLLVISQFAIGVGILNLLKHHLQQVGQKKPGWMFSIALLLSFLVMLVVGFWNYYKPNGWSTPVFDILFNRLYMPLGSTVFSLLAFYLVTAAYRAFKIKTVEAGMLVLSACLVMLGQVPVGIWLTSWLPDTGTLSFLRMEHIVAWLLHIANTAGVRALMLGASIGAIAMALRVWLGIERGMFLEMKSL